MKALIIEDEKLAAERLILLLQQYDPGICVLKVLESIEESISWFRSNEGAMPDFILLDINLSDGVAFDIFQQVNIKVPVIFTTAYDQYALDAFRLLSIDYLLKPISIQSLTTAIDKLKHLQGNLKAQSQTINYKEITGLLQYKPTGYKNRFIGKIGQKLYFIDSEQIAFLMADNKIVYLTTMDNCKYLIDYTLEQLELLLDPHCFFRINRSMIVNVKAIDQVKPYINNRLKIQFKRNLGTTETIISRERVADFRKWADN